MINLLTSLLAFSLTANPALPSELDGKPYVITSCVTNNRSIFLVLMLDGKQHSVLEILNSKNSLIVTRSEIFEFSKTGKPFAVEFSSGVASENELAFYRDYLLQKPLSFSANYDWVKKPKKMKCPIYLDPYN
jgi:hypothetical protein